MRQVREFLRLISGRRAHEDLVALEQHFAAVWFEHFKCLPMPDGSLLHSKWCLNR